MRPSWDETWMAMARTIALRSPCDRDKVGAVVVSASNRMVDTGYNGPPRGFKAMTATGDELINDGCSRWCPRALKRPGDPARPGEFFETDYSDCPALHAEQNALMFGDRTAREGGSIYVSSSVCNICAKLIANSGLETVIMDETGPLVHRRSKLWVEFMESCGLTVVII